ncbi:MAG: tRNA (guanosine(46)-N7)-methyltransferase TrmB [Beijerinckiaceae bacterium]|nr:tRNA (guanosine(46)-N7)-methyltransferase TrmB [Beijerinckiaceae bacterium]
MGKDRSRAGPEKGHCLIDLAVNPVDPNNLDGEGPARAPRRQLYGRSKGKALRAAQAARIEGQLPGLTIPLDSLSEGPRPLFSRPMAEFRLEIGFGGGEHLAAQARQNPGIGYLGVEPFLNGVAKLLAAIEADSLDNIRLLRGDGRDILAALPEGSLARVDLLYPDPWPKRRQRKRRIVDPAFLDAVVRALSPGGEFRFATDIDDYAGWTLARILPRTDLVWLAETAADWSEPWAGWHRTRYEEKAIREGRVPGYFRFRKA